MQTVPATEHPISASTGVPSLSTASLPGFELWIEGRIARIRLSESARGNLLTTSRIVGIRELLAALAGERQVELVVIEGEAGVFCSGPDLPAFYRARTDGADAAREFARAASGLVLDVARCPKPILAMMDGVVVGGGLALGAHATYRVVTERTRIALPQTAVGLVTDLGLSRQLARAPAGIGAYLCLTGVGIGPADAIYTGFADGFVHSDRLEYMCEKLANPFAGPIEDILNAYAQVPGESQLTINSRGIAAAFGQPSVSGILDTLSTLGEDWGKPAEAAILSGSPVAMQLSLALIRQAGERRRLEDCLRAEHHFVCKLLDCGEAYEGIGARLVEPLRLPRWLAARPADVDAQVLASFLTPLLPGDGLGLPTGLNS